MVPESSRGRGGSRGGRGGRGAKKVAIPKGKGRRNEEERKQMLQQERERNKERDAAYAAQMNAEKIAAEKEGRERLRLANRGRGRGRGGYMGDRPVAGPFSMGSNISGSSGRAFPRPWAPSDPRTQRGNASAPQFPHIQSGSGIKREGGGSGDGARGVSIKRENTSGYGYQSTFADSNDPYVTRTVEDGGYISSDLDEHEQGPRQDVDFINETIDLTADDKTAAGGDEPTASEPATHRYNSPAQAPIRINRFEHRDRAPPVNPEAGEIKIKPQPEDDLMDVDQQVSTVKKGKQKANEVQVIGSSRRWRGVYEDEPEFVHVKQEPVDDAIEPPLAVGRPGRAKVEDTKPRRHYRINKDPPAHLQTEEERAEFYRHDHDLQLLVEELSHIGPTTEATPTAANASTTQAMPDQKEDRVYLFQLPPVVPNLTIHSPIVIKDEPVEGVQNTTEAGQQQPPAPSTAAEGPPVTIKIEDEKSDSKKPKHLPILSSGLAGKLRVHRSGKVTLNWGGTSLQVSKGMDSGFLQDILMVRKSDEARGASAGPENSRATGGEALAFGQLRGKFVVTPDWDEVLG